MKRWMHYLDYRAPDYGGIIIDQESDEELVESGLRCPDGCGGIPAEFEGEPITLSFVKKPMGMYEPAPRAPALHLDLWRLISKHLDDAVVGTCELVAGKNNSTPLDEFVSIYVPVKYRPCLRGRKKYSICKSCGAVRCDDFATTKYLLGSDIAGRRAVMSMSRGILVDDGIRKKIEDQKFRSVGFYSYEVLDEPLDGRPKSLDDWPQLAKWRKPKKRK